MPFQRVNQSRLEVAYAVPTPALAPWVHRGSMPGLPKAIRFPRNFAMGILHHSLIRRYRCVVSVLEPRNPAKLSLSRTAYAKLATETYHRQQFSGGPTA